MKTLPAENDPWHKFSVALVAAIKGVSQPYFSIRRTTGDSTWSERPYCYELYHQLRCRLGDKYGYTLHGELDKRHGDEMRQIFDGAIPDMVLHESDTYNNNFVVIEVKSSAANRVDIEGDLAKLTTLTTRARYSHGILLVFGSDNGWSQGLDMTASSISVLWHKAAGSAPVPLNNQPKWQFMPAANEGSSSTCC